MQTPELAAEDLNVKVTERGTIRSSVRGAALLPPRLVLASALDQGDSVLGRGRPHRAGRCSVTGE